jgi:SAM-dependent methyltransferase
MTLMEQLDWRGDHFVLAGYTFRLQHQTAEHIGVDAFFFYKTRAQIEQFDRFLAETTLCPQRVLELGIWDGASAAFWAETLNLKAYAAIDLQIRGDSPYLQRWQADRGHGRVTTHWGVDQTDGHALMPIIAENHLEPLDLILDDCSHQYKPTLESFQLLFNQVRPGGYYVIEDWAWALQPEFLRRDHPWGVHRALHPVVHRLLDLHGARPDLIPSVKVYPDFVALERGAPSIGPVDVASLTPRRPRPWPLVARKHTRRVAGRLRRSLSRKC